MTFPLPDGICREVCRPPRSMPRLMNAKDAIRMAKAAVRNGEDACQVARGVSLAVGCTCDKEVQDVADGRHILDKAIDEFRIAVGKLAEQLGLEAGKLKGQIDQPTDSLTRRLLRRLSAFISAYEIIKAMIRVYNAGDELEKAFVVFMNDVQRLLLCVQGVKSDGNQ